MSCCRRTTTAGVGVGVAPRLRVVRELAGAMRSGGSSRSRGVELLGEHHVTGRAESRGRHCPLATQPALARSIAASIRSSAPAGSIAKRPPGACSVLDEVRRAHVRGRVRSPDTLQRRERRVQRPPPHRPAAKLHHSARLCRNCSSSCLRRRHRRSRRPATPTPRAPSRVPSRISIAVKCSQASARTRSEPSSSVGANGTPAPSGARAISCQNHP